GPGGGGLGRGRLVGEVSFEHQVDGLEEDVAGAGLEPAEPERQVARRDLEPERELHRPADDLHGAHQRADMHIRHGSPDVIPTTTGCASHYTDVNWGPR